MNNSIILTLEGKEITVDNDIMKKALAFYLTNAPEAKDQKLETSQATTINNIKIGETFFYGGIKWVKLDDAHGGALVLAVNKQANSAFDKNESNNWATSSLRKDLNVTKNGCFTVAFLKDVNIEDLIEFDRDLTTDDGKTEYGTCKDFVSLYTCDEYRKYRKLIPECGEWYWTITGDSLVYSRIVRYVDSSGALDCYDAYSGSGGVRPLCVLKANTIVTRLES